jgi:dTDP-glucose pyrophosphorylase
MNQKRIDIQSLLIKASSSISEAIRVIDIGHVQIGLVVDDENRLIGTVTDGDIRRALLRNETLETPVEQIMFRKFRALPIHATEEEALALMRRESLHQIPVIDGKGRIARLFLLEDLTNPKKHSNPVVIMAGGEGKRLYPLTRNCPKPMLRVGGKPLLEIILEQCVDAGFYNFYFSVNYLKEQIKNYFGNGSRWNVCIDYLEETQPLGTGGALSLLPNKSLETLLVLNGDVLTRVDYAKLINFHNELQAAATICVRDYTTQIPYGVVRMNGSNVLMLEEKPIVSHHVNAGIYSLDPALLRLVPRNRLFDMPQLLESAIRHNYRVSAYPIHEYWVDVGQHETLERAKRDWKVS